jgi:hypothetical protein
LSSTMRRSPGGAMLTCSALSVLFGQGSVIGVSRSGSSTSSSESRAQP